MANDQKDIIMKDNIIIITEKNQEKIEEKRNVVILKNVKKDEMLVEKLNFLVYIKLLIKVVHGLVHLLLQLFQIMVHLDGH